MGLTLYFYQSRKDVTYNRSNNSKVPVHLVPGAPKSQRKEKRERNIALKDYINMIPNSFKEQTQPFIVSFLESRFSVCF